MARSRILRPYLLGAISSAAGDAMATFGFLFVAYDLTGSAALVSLVALAEAAPYLLFGLLGGAVADRARQTRLILVIDTGRAVCQMVTFVLALTGHLEFLLLLLVAFTMQLGGCFVSPARRALLPTLAPRPELPTANAMLDTGQTAAILIAPAVTALALATSGPAVFFLIDALSYSASVGTLLLVVRRSPNCARRVGWVAVGSIAVGRRVGAPLMTAARDIRAFLGSAAREQMLRSLLLTTFLVVAATTWSRQIGMLLLAENGSSAGELLYSVLMAVLALAGLAAGLALPHFVRQPGVLHYAIGGMVWGCGLVLASAPLGIPSLTAGAVLQGMGAAIAGGSRSNALYTILPAGRRAQGFAAAATLLYLADVVSVSVGAALSVLLGTRTLMLLAGLLTVGVSALMAVPILTAHRGIDRDEDRRSDHRQGQRLGDRDADQGRVHPQPRDVT